MKQSIIKNYYLGILGMLILLCLGAPTLSQSRRDFQVAIDSLNRQIQTLETVNDSLEARIAAGDNLEAGIAPTDSLQQRSQEYENFYVYIRDGYFPEHAKNYKIEETMALVDSLADSRSAALLDLETSAGKLADSLTYMKRTNDSLGIEIQAFKNILDLLVSDKRYPRQAMDFLGDWKLFLYPVSLYGESPQAGLVSREQIILSDSLHDNMLQRLVFEEDEIADLYFSNGKRVRCFYKINNFNPKETFTIDLVRHEVVNIRLYISYVPRGLQVTYESASTGKKGEKMFYFGYMRL